MAAEVAIQWVVATTPKLPLISGRVVKANGGRDMEAFINKRTNRAYHLGTTGRYQYNVCNGKHFLCQQGPVYAAVGFARSEEHTSELQSLMRISYAVFCLKKKTKKRKQKCHINNLLHYTSIT